jgi:hypothetical protein
MLEINVDVSQTKLKSWDLRAWWWLRYLMWELIKKNSIIYQ